MSAARGRSMFRLADEDATLAMGTSLATAPPLLALGESNSAWCVYLEGPLGAGKTTLVRGFLRAFGHRGTVKSPTYTLLEPYEVITSSSSGPVAVFHFDLYRLRDPEELEMLGIRDFIGERRAICFFEWPERGQGLLPSPDLAVYLRVADTGRELELCGHSSRAEEVVSAVTADYTPPCFKGE